MTLLELEALLKTPGTSKEEQIRLLRRTRGQLLEEIHDKQQQLDRLDYLLHTIQHA